MIDKIYTKDDTVFIVGGGASLEGFDFGQLHGLKCIVINKAYRKVKRADALYFGDTNFHRSDGNSLWRFLGDKIYTICKIERTERTDPRLEKIKLNFKPCNSGLGAIFLAVRMGAKKIVLLGFDCKYTNRKKNWHDIEQVSERHAREALTYENMLKDFPEAVKKLKKIDIINASIDSAIECFPKKDISEYFKPPFIDVHKLEKTKYEKAWDSDKYRIHSPALREGVERFMKSKLKPKGGTLTDWGCGSGRASMMMAASFAVTALDITKTALDKEVKKAIHQGKLVFQEMNMWEQFGVRTDYAFSCDVLEHIPEDKVDAVLENIKRNTLKGGFLQIALTEHIFEGQQLHLTVKPADWWITKVGNYFNVIDVEETEKHVCLTFKTK